MKVEDAYLCVQCDGVFEARGVVPMSCPYCGDSSLLSLNKVIKEGEVKVGEEVIVKVVEEKKDT